jgi:hypothetical protein
VLQQSAALFPVRHGFSLRRLSLLSNVFWPPEVNGVANVDHSLPDGEYYCLTAFVAKGSDFTLDEAMARVRAALPGRVARGFPTRRDRRVLGPWDGEQIVGFFIEAIAGDRPAAEGEDAPAPGRAPAAVLRACEILSGFQGVGVYDQGQGKALCRLSSR